MIEGPTWFQFWTVILSAITTLIVSQLLPSFTRYFYRLWGCNVDININSPYLLGSNTDTEDKKLRVYILNKDRSKLYLHCMALFSEKGKEKINFNNLVVTEKQNEDPYTFYPNKNILDSGDVLVVEIKPDQDLIKSLKKEGVTLSFVTAYGANVSPVLLIKSDRMVIKRVKWLWAKKGIVTEYLKGIPPLPT